MLLNIVPQWAGWHSCMLLLLNSCKIAVSREFPPPSFFGNVINLFWYLLESYLALLRKSLFSLAHFFPWIYSGKGVNSNVQKKPAVLNEMITEGTLDLRCFREVIPFFSSAWDYCLWICFLSSYILIITLCQWVCFQLWWRIMPENK